MKEIPLNHGYVARVDDDDYERLAKHKWYARVVRHKASVKVYAARQVWVPGGRPVYVKMHQEILGFAGRTDHADNDGLNNQRHNLRPATGAQNNANSIKTGRKTSSRFKGVWWRKHIGKWAAAIRKDGKIYCLGDFRDEVDAATAYNLKAYELFGEFARPNLPLAAAKEPKSNAE